MLFAKIRSDQSKFKQVRGLRLPKHVYTATCSSSLVNNGILLSDERLGGANRFNDVRNKENSMNATTN
jgi:hypothetical protein